MPGKSDNLRELRRIVGRLKSQVAVEAVAAGQDVILSAMRRRCPVGETHHLLQSIHKTKIGVGKKAVVGAVNVGTDYGFAVEFGPHARPFVRATRHIDGPIAENAMKAVIERSR